MTGAALIAKHRLICIFTAFILISNVSPLYANERITWMGCGISRKAFMEEIAKAYTEKYDIKFRMAGGGATKGIRLTANGIADVGGSCRHVLRLNGDIVSEEQGVTMVHVAWDAIVVITHKSNPVKNISSQQLRNIYVGKISNWQSLGGDNQAIDVNVRSSSISGVSYMFRMLIFDDPHFELPIKTLQHESSGPLEKNIESRSIYGIAVTGISSARKRAVSILSIDGVYPSKQNIASGQYPYFRPLYMVVLNHPQQKTRDIMNYILSEEGQAIISQQGTINLKEGKKLEKRWTMTPLIQQVP
ncbi:substrate-binding domain-containing protein [Shewanella sp. YLB-07]|uniref:substrate-binding domain-containing protein n=1 Tax=Shewanella sp. YLB-07 TaxID=2601268 RepID=UPI00128E5A98|nr:substrate-binding domain-containing protein [Shewanella sp. YLB-07]MPY24417.1 phosphate ABC transporter substrate-binding protein [Shewanella sp. YLB-07]